MPKCNFLASTLHHNAPQSDTVIMVVEETFSSYPVILQPTKWWILARKHKFCIS